MRLDNDYVLNYLDLVSAQLKSDIFLSDIFEHFFSG